MIKINKLKRTDLSKIDSLISEEKEDYNFFLKSGWNYKSIHNHFQKQNNLSLGCFIENAILGFLIGEKININEQNILDVHIIYVSVKKRRYNIGSKILNYFLQNKFSTKISKIYVEVAENNMEAIKFYEKNNFVFYKFRHNYYMNENKSINAKCYYKNI